MRKMTRVWKAWPALAFPWAGYFIWPWSTADAFIMGAGTVAAVMMVVIALVGIGGESR